MVRNKNEYTLNTVQSVYMHSIEKNTLEVDGDQQSSTYLLCSAEERKSFRFGSLVSVNDDRVLFLFLS